MIKCKKCDDGYITQNKELNIYWCDSAVCDNAGYIEPLKKTKTSEARKQYQKKYMRRIRAKNK